MAETARHWEKRTRKWPDSVGCGRVKAWLPVVSYRHGNCNEGRDSEYNGGAEDHGQIKGKSKAGASVLSCVVYNVLDFDRAHLARGAGLSCG